MDRGSSYLLNVNNKSQLVTLLAERFAEDDQKMYACVGDHDSKIADVAIGKAKSTEVMVIADDSDVAIYCITKMEVCLISTSTKKEIRNVGVLRKPSQRYLSLGGPTFHPRFDPT